MDLLSVFAVILFLTYLCQIIDSGIFILQEQQQQQDLPQVSCFSSDLILNANAKMLISLIYILFINVRNGLLYKLAVGS